MMEMNGRECAKCQKSKRRDTNGINGKFNDNKDEIGNSVILFPLFKRQKREGGGEINSELRL